MVPGMQLSFDRAGYILLSTADEERLSIFIIYFWTRGHCEISTGEEAYFLSLGTMPSEGSWSTNTFALEMRINESEKGIKLNFNPFGR